jgi:hypothetical protein
MKTLARAVSWLALAATLAPAIAYFAGGIGLPHMKAWMLAAAVAWFAATPYWARTPR